MAKKHNVEEEPVDESAEVAEPQAPPPQNYKPPKLGAREVMATYKNSMTILRGQRLLALSRKFPEVAKLLKSQPKLSVKAQPSGDNPPPAV